jgi:hypothetical protein
MILLFSPLRPSGPDFRKVRFEIFAQRAGRWQDEFSSEQRGVSLMPRREIDALNLKMEPFYDEFFWRQEKATRSN